MKRLAKWLVGALVVLLAAVGLLVTCTGIAIKKGVENMAAPAVNAGPQTAVVTAQGAVITTELAPKMRIVLQDVELCQPQGTTPSRDYSYAGGCFNGACRATIDFKDRPIPKDLTIHRMFNGQCVEQTIPDIVNYRTVDGYEASIVIDDALAKQLGIAERKVNKTATSQFRGHHMITVGSTTKLSLVYVGPVAQDTLMLGTTPITLQLTAPAAAAPQAAPANQ